MINKRSNDIGVKGLFGMAFGFWIVAVALNLAFWGGVVWIALSALKHFGVI